MELYYKRAIYVGGYATENWIGYSHGHDWVIDGYKDVYRVWGVYNNFYDENYNLIRQEPGGGTQRARDPLVALQLRMGRNR